MRSQPAALGAPPPAAAGLTLHLLAGFALERSGEPVVVPATGQRLLAYLALRDGSAPRSEVAEALWLDTTSEHASASLRTTLWRLPRPGGAPLVSTGNGTLLVAPDVRVDVWRLRAALEVVDDDPRAVVEQVGAALGADLLPGWFDEWVLLARERHRQRRLHALEKLSHALSGVGSHAEAVDLGLAAVEAEPLRESAHRAVVAAHLAEGNVGEAWRQFEAFRALLLTELGVEPTAGFRALLDSPPGILPP
jgi:DNA-binding SARP family transcriptional activator